jgi:hypothetical protein
MSVLGPFDRPVGLAHATSALWRRPGLHPPTSGSPTHSGAFAGRPDVANAEFLTTTLLCEASNGVGHVADVEAAVDEMVVVWGPSFYTTSRTELITALLESDDALTDIQVDIVDTVTDSSRAYVEWRASGRFDRAAFLNDDVLVEPSYRTVVTAGVTAFDFVGDHAARVNFYYDGLSLLEQVLPPGMVCGRPSG